MYLICQGAGTASVSYKFASQREHPLYRQVGALAWVHEAGAGVNPPLQPAELGNFPRDHHLGWCPFQWLWRCNSSSCHQDVLQCMNHWDGFQKVFICLAQKLFLFLTCELSQLTSTHHAPLLQFLIWHFEPFWQKNINLNSSFMFTSEQWLCVGVTAGRSFARVRPSKVTSDSLFSFSRTGILP